MTTHQHDHHPGHHHSGAGNGEADMAELLDLEAEVLHAYLSDVIDWVGGLTAGQPGRIADLGAGTGTGTFALLRHFRAADAVAVDVSAPMLDRLQAKARELGMADRIRTVQADLDAEWPDLGPADLVWASNSLHHLADPDRVLAQVFTALQPGGLLAVVEMDAFPRFLPDDMGLGRPGLEDRCEAARAAQHASEMPHLGADWGPHLTGAGFTIEARRTFAIDLAPPLPAAARRFAQAWLRRLRSGLESVLSAEDLATLDTLTDGDGPASVLRRGDLTVRTTRTVWAARRPEPGPKWSVS
jgi:SAM-dependent methyltransferase